MRQSSGPCEIAQVDVRDSASVKAFFDRVAAHWGGLDAIASITGPPIPMCRMLEVKEEGFKRIYETDVHGSFHVLRHGGLTLKAGGGGAMVLFLTTAVLRTLENDSMYGGPKSAVAALVDFLTSADAAYISGQVIAIDGAYSA